MHHGEKSEDEIDGMKVHRIRPRLFFRLKEMSRRSKSKTIASAIYNTAIYIHRIKGLIFFWDFPMESPLACEKYLHTTEKICKDYRISKIIAMYMPIEAAYVVTKIRKRIESCRICFVGGDTFTNTSNAHKYPIIYRIGLRWEKKIFRESDCVLHLKSNAKNYEEPVFHEFKGKIRIVDIPFPEWRPRRWEIRNLSAGTINLMYMGGL